MMGWDIPGLLAPKKMKQEDQEVKTKWGSLVRMTEKLITLIISSRVILTIDSDKEKKIKAKCTVTVPSTVGAFRVKCNLTS